METEQQQVCQFPILPMALLGIEISFTGRTQRDLTRTCLTSMNLNLRPRNTLDEATFSHVRSGSGPVGPHIGLAVNKWCHPPFWPFIRQREPRRPCPITCAAPRDMNRLGPLPLADGTGIAPYLLLQLMQDNSHSF